MSSHRRRRNRPIPPIEQRFAPPPRPRRKAGREVRFWSELAMACVVAASLSASVVLAPESVWTLAQSIPVQAIAIGMASAMALYLYMLPIGSKIHAGQAARKVLAGGIFGLIAAKAGAGFGLNDSLQTAAAGVGGARGPDYMDQLAKKFTG